MLPGLRILFAITLLSVSVVIFALGAAAFLRTAHEDVANAPWRPIETPVTARVDLAPTTLSMLRVEPEATIAVLTARADAAAAASPAPAETKPDIPTETAPRVTPEQSRIEQPAISAPAKPQEPPAAAQTDPAPEAVVAAVEPAREQAPAVTETKAEDTKAAATKSSETKTSETKAAGPGDTQPAPTVVAALSTDKAEQTRTTTALEPVSAPQESLDLPVDVAVPAEVRTGADTLKADDKSIKTTPAKVAALAEPATASTPPLPSKDVRIPNPRVDPAVIEARRKQQQQQHLAQLRARARAAARSRRIAAARAARAAQARAAAAANPFGAPSSNTNTRSN